jgi:hypothetical protein
MDSSKAKSMLAKRMRGIYFSMICLTAGLLIGVFAVKNLLAAFDSSLELQSVSRPVLQTVSCLQLITATCFLILSYVNYRKR